MNEPSEIHNRRTALETVKLKPARKSGKPPTGREPGELPVAFIYLRVSTKEQARTGGGAEGYSLPAQREACRAKAAQLGAVIHEEYCDAGESARSADRDDLQRMLQDVKTVRPDYVIVHKIDRLARNRADDIAINLALQKHGVRLISCTENIDETPSGRLLYGLLAEIAQFYSGNLALEVMKGLLRKAEEGGTPFRAPLGYRNAHETINGVIAATVVFDPERAELVRWCLEQYATGEWTVADLTLAAQAKGLTSRATPKRPAKPISLTGMHNLLQNPYYMGVVSYRGIHYEGKHEPLIEPETWLSIQDTLASHNHTGEKDRKHTHYLRGTIYCSACGARLVFSRHQGNGGTYDYFLCVKKKTKANNCTRPAVRVERVEDGIAAFYQRFQLTPTVSAQIQAAVRAELAEQQQEAKVHLARALQRKEQIHDERAKLLQAHYTGAIPQDLLVSEMERFTRSLAGVEREISACQASSADIEETLKAALTAATHCTGAYVNAPPDIRRQINQGFFQKLYIGEDGSVEERELTEPFAALLEGEVVVRDVAGGDTATTNTLNSEDASTTDGDMTDRARPSNVLRTTFGEVTESLGGENDIRNEHTPREMDLSGRGVNEHVLVELRGIEPLTFSMRTRRATNCATAPCLKPVEHNSARRGPGEGVTLRTRGGRGVRPVRPVRGRRGPRRRCRRRRRAGGCGWSARACVRSRRVRGGAG
jgi:site-specific DNA recombinase